MSKNIRKVVDNYLDNINSASSKSNMMDRMRPILSKYFLFNDESGKKTYFSKLLYNNKDYLKNSKPKISIKNNKNATISFNKLKHKIYLDENNQINKINIKNTQSGGIGYTYAVGMSPIAGKPVISSYYNCCRPIFNGSLLQNGGKLNTAYYLDVSKNQINVLPQYKKYIDPLN